MPVLRETDRETSIMVRMRLKRILVAIAIVLVNSCAYRKLVETKVENRKHSSVRIAPRSAQERPSYQTRNKTGLRDDICRLWGEKPQWSHVTPTWKLDPTRYLYPGVYWGPNNQVRQLMTTTYLAIKLNRTLVIPNFHTHGTVGGKTIEPHHRIDVEHLCQFVSCISLQQFQAVCKGSFDVLFLSIMLQGEFLRDIVTDSGMKVPRYSRNKFTVPTYYAKEKSSAEEIFISNRSCALLFGADQTESVRPTFGPELRTVWQRNERDLNWAVVDAVNRLPKPIVATAEQFVQEMFAGESYVGVHWRYGDADWKNYCLMKESIHAEVHVCLTYRAVSAANVATAIYKDLQKFFPRFQKRINIYIATPPTQQYFARDIFKKLKSFNSSFYTPPIPLSEFASTRLTACMKDNKWNPDESLSMIEMAMMIRSEFFYYSTWSSWSKNCRYSRRNSVNDSRPFEMQYDASVFDLSEAVMREEKMKFM